MTYFKRKYQFPYPQKKKMNFFSQISFPAIVETATDAELAKL